MKMQKFVIFIKNNLKINMFKMKNIVILGTFWGHYTGEKRNYGHNICNLKYRVPK